MGCRLALDTYNVAGWGRNHHSSVYILEGDGHLTWIGSSYNGTFK